MSKASSGHFTGTNGERRISSTEGSNSDIIASRVKGFDLREHPIKYKSKTSFAKIKQKVDSRSATKEEYKKLYQKQRLNDKRREAVKQFWSKERERIIAGQKTTRAWSAEQIKDILSGHAPKFNGKTMEGHHTYSVSKYPHLAGYSEVIFPVTHNEHFYGWHGGSYYKSLPGKPISNISDF